MFKCCKKKKKKWCKHKLKSLYITSCLKDNDVGWSRYNKHSEIFNAMEQYVEVGEKGFHILYRNIQRKDK